jgi:hypothetical protein
MLPTYGLNSSAGIEVDQHHVAISDFGASCSIWEVRAQSGLAAVQQGRCSNFDRAYVGSADGADIGIRDINCRFALKRMENLL